MDECLLMTSQKNEILTLIKEEELDPNRFMWIKMPSVKTHGAMIYHLRYMGEHVFFYRFEFLNNNHYAIFAPGSDKPEDEDYPGDWSSQKQCFKAWLRNVKREVDQRDLWEEITKQRISSDYNLESDFFGQPFNEDEIERIEIAIQNVCVIIKENASFTKEIENRLEFLVDVAKKSTRREWIFLCIGVFVPTAIQLAFNLQQLQTMFRIVENALGLATRILPLIK